jgi:hypothetical protein
LRVKAAKSVGTTAVADKTRGKNNGSGENNTVSYSSSLSAKDTLFVSTASKEDVTNNSGGSQAKDYSSRSSVCKETAKEPANKHQILHLLPQLAAISETCKKGCCILCYLRHANYSSIDSKF